MFCDPLQSRHAHPKLIGLLGYNRSVGICSYPTASFSACARGTDRYVKRVNWKDLRDGLGSVGSCTSQYNIISKIYNKNKRDFALMDMSGPCHRVDIEADFPLRDGKLCPDCCVV